MAYNLLRQISIVSSNGMFVKRGCEQGTDVKRAHHFIVMFLHLGPISKAERVLDSGLICGDGLKYAHKIRSQIVIVRVHRGNNRMGKGNFEACLHYRGKMARVR